ncbi:MAG: hypothetical protein QI223_03445 [Candidatus Korarchaeota archaeon]|nr:hypothetical protein [Candidatus Korarchaeota archaeon]
MHRAIQAALLLLVSLVAAAGIFGASPSPEAGREGARAAAEAVAAALARVAARADPPTCEAEGKILVNVETRGEALIRVEPGDPAVVTVTVGRAFGPWRSSWGWSVAVDLPDGVSAVESSAGEGGVVVWLRGCRVGVSGGGG